jgi:hypothetical protein
MHQHSTTQFLVTDDPNTSCGVAGMAWCSTGDIYVPSLPNVHDGALKARAVKTYAKLTCVSEEWVRRKRPISRSFYAIKIRRKKEKWGVVVIDSTDQVLPQEEIAKVFFHTQRFFSLFATRV